MYSLTELFGLIKEGKIELPEHFKGKLANKTPKY